MNFKTKIARIDIDQAFKLEKRMLKDNINYTQFIIDVIELYLNNELISSGNRIIVNRDFKGKKENEVIKIVSENIKDILTENNITFGIAQTQENNITFDIAQTQENNLAEDGKKLLIEFLSDITIKDKDTDKNYLKAVFKAGQVGNVTIAPFITDYFKKNNLAVPRVKSISKYFYSKKDKRYFRLTEIMDILAKFNDFKEIELIFDDHLNQSP